MRLLPPIDEIPNAGDAAGWRVRVAAAKPTRESWANKRRELVPGCTVRLRRPVRMNAIAVTTDVLTIMAYDKRTPIFAPPSHPQYHCRLPLAHLASATVTP